MTISLKNALILMIGICTLNSGSDACAPLGLGGGGCCAPPPPVTCGGCGSGCASRIQQQCAEGGGFLAAPLPPPLQTLSQQYAYQANNDYRPIVSYATAPPSLLPPPPPPPSYIVPVQSSRSQTFLSQGNYYNTGADPISVGGGSAFPTENRGMDAETSYAVGGLFPPQQEVTEVNAEKHTNPSTPPAVPAIERTRKIVASYFTSTTPNGQAVTSEIEDNFVTRSPTNSHITTRPSGASTIIFEPPLRSGDSKTNSLGKGDSKTEENDNVTHSVKETTLTNASDNPAENRGNMLSGGMEGSRHEASDVDKYAKMSNYHHAESRYHAMYSTGHSSGERSGSEHRHFNDVDRHRSKAQTFYANSENQEDNEHRSTAEPMLPTIYLASSLDNADYDYGGGPLSSSSDTTEITGPSRAYPSFSKTHPTMRQSSTTFATTPSGKHSSIISHQEEGKLNAHESDLTTSGTSGKLLSNSKAHRNVGDLKELSHESSSSPTTNPQRSANITHSHMSLIRPSTNPHEKESVHYITATSAPSSNPYDSNSVETHSLIDQLQDESDVNNLASRNSSGNATAVPIPSHEQYALHHALSAQIASVDETSAEMKMKDEKWANDNPASQKASTAENLEYLAVVRDTVQERRIDPYIIYYNQNCQGIYLGRSVENSSIDAAEKCSRLGCAAINLRPIRSSESENAPDKVEVIFLKIAEARHFADGQNCMSVLNIPRHTRQSRPHNDGVGIHRPSDRHGRNTVVPMGVLASQRLVEVNPLRYSPKLLRDPSLQYRFATTMGEPRGNVKPTGQDLI